MSATAFANADAAQLRKFGQSVTFTPTAGSPQTVTVVLSSGDAVEQQHEGAHYTAWAPLTSFSVAPKKSDSMTISSQNFRVADVLPGGPPSAPSVTLVLKYIRP